MSARILLINEFASLNGGERSLLANLSVQRDDFDFAAAIPAGSLAEALNRIGIETFSLPDSGNQFDEQLASLVHQCKPDLVHANSLNMSRRVGRIATEIAVPTLGHCRDIFGMSKKAVSDLNQLTRMVFVSKAAFDFHIEQGVRSDFGTVIHNGVDLDHFRPREPTGDVHCELGLAPSARLLLSIGQIGMRKGPDFLLDAFEKVSGLLQGAHLLVVGQRYSQKDEAIEYERNLHRRCAENSFGDRVHFLGTRDDVAKLMNEASALVHSARQEPLGRVLLESAASGLPVVATDVGGTREIFPASDCGGILVEANDAEAFASAVRILIDPATQKAMRTQARLRAENAFDQNESARRVSDVYRELIGD